MATNSIYKNIAIKKNHEGRRLVSALEYASRKTTPSVIISKKCREVKGEQIKTLFGDR